MGAGKSTVATELSCRLQCDCVDIDEQVEISFGKTIPEIFSSQGESAFRALEHGALKQALGQSEPAIIACGGGIVLESRNRELLKSDTLCVYLEVSPEHIMDRIIDSTTRPLMQGIEGLRSLEPLIMQRMGFYEELADIIVDTDNCTPDEVCDTILAAIEGEEYGVFHP
jgi:shikimate kinase